VCSSDLVASLVLIRSSSVSTSKATSFDRHQLVQAKQHPVLLHRREKERTNLINVNQYQQNGQLLRIRQSTQQLCRNDNIEL